MGCKSKVILRTLFGWFLNSGSAYTSIFLRDNNREITTTFARYPCLVNFDQAEITRYNYSKTWKFTKKCVDGCILSHICPISARLGDSVTSCWICWSCIDIIPYYMDWYPVPMIWNLALSHIFDPILRVFDFPSQKTLICSIFLIFSSKLRWEEFYMKASRVPVAHPLPKNF